MSRPSANDLYKAAKRFARNGQPVFPIHASGEKVKRPLTKHGWKDATTDGEQIKRWWRRYGENAAIGIPTGVKWDVLDVDTKGEADGRVHLPKLNRLGLLNGCKFVVRTPSGGWHLYFTASPGTTNKAHAGLGLDVRASGGYVLAPPSYIETDEYEGAYTHAGDTEGSTDEPLLWELIAQSLAPTNERTNKEIDLLGYERQASLASLRGWLLERRPGERNNSLHWAVCRCIDHGIDPHELVDVALEIGLDEDEVTLTIGSALRRAGVDADDLDSEVEVLFPES